MLTVLSIEHASPLAGKVHPGDRLLTLNGSPVEDYLDWLWLSAEDRLVLTLRAPDDRERTVKLRRDESASLGIEFAPDRIRLCGNHCVFCFCDQAPKTLRPGLSVKDEDYRLSFLYGNYLTLTNLRPADYARILERRISPLYVSVHCTDPDLRAKLLGRPKPAPILPTLERLLEGGISLHTQLVVVSGMNDGEVLTRTLTDLLALGPGVESIAVVPVGLTRFRDGLPSLHVPTTAEASDALDRMTACKAPKGLLQAADEWFFLAGRPLPSRAYYGEFPQLDNGVGMVRQYLDAWSRRAKRFAEKGPLRDDVTLVTGRRFGPILAETLGKYAEVLALPSFFWGESVTVANLLTGSDLLAGLATSSRRGPVWLPPGIVNADNLFLDDLSLAEATERAGRELRVAPDDWGRFFKEFTDAR